MSISIAPTGAVPHSSIGLFAQSTLQVFMPVIHQRAPQCCSALHGLHLCPSDKRACTPAEATTGSSRMCTTLEGK